MVGLRAGVQQIFLDLQRKRGRYHTLNQIYLDRSAVLANIRLLQKRHAGLGIIPVLKGNAYGHGLKEVAAILNEAQCEMLAVDGYFEAGKIRHVSRHRLLVLGYISPDNVRLVDTRRCSFVVQDEQTLRAFGALKKPVRIHLELNTGLNRLGLQTSELAGYLTLLQQFPQLSLEGVMTHLADADNDTSDEYTDRQVQLFDKCMEKILAANFRPRIVHVAQTAGSTKVRSRYATALRLGIGLYGINPLYPADSKYEQLEGLRPVLLLKSTIIKAITLQAGDKVSYNGTFTAPARMRIGILPLGYYEGVPARLGNGGAVTHQDRALPIVGKVCMNHTMIDLADTNLGVGDEVTVFHNDPHMPNSVLRASRQHGLSPYVVLSKLSSSIRRHVY